MTEQVSQFCSKGPASKSEQSSFAAATADEISLQLCAAIQPLLVSDYMFQGWLFQVVDSLLGLLCMKNPNHQIIIVT